MIWNISEKKDFFDRISTSLIRGICMIFIMLHHSFQHGLSDALQFGSIQSKALRDAGYLCTSVFFMLSGFGLYMSIQNKSFNLSNTYIKNKFLKLFVPFLLYFFVYWFISYSRNLVSWDDLLFVFLLSLPNGEPIWFFIVITFVYLVTFSIFRYKIVHPIYVITLSVLIYAVVVRASMIGLHWYNSIICFPAGLLIAKYYAYLKSYASYKYLILIFLLFLLNYPKAQCFSGILFSLIFLIVFRYIPFQACRIFNWLKFIGDNSLLFFFSHSLGFLLCPIKPSQFNFFVYCLVEFLISMIITYLMYLIQKPILKVLNK